MIKKLIRRMLTAQTLSALTVSLCLMIDNIIIGRYLGVGAVASYGYANPILLIIGAIATTISAGVQVVCSRSLGRGSQEETNQGYSTALALVLLISIPFMLLIILLSSPLSAALSSQRGTTIYKDTQGYMIGFIIGAPATMGALAMVPFLQMAGQNGVLVISVLVMSVADIALDLLNVHVFKMGMFGMGLASSLSYYLALLVGGSYFFTKKCPFKFSVKNILKTKMAEIFKAGIPTIFTMASSVVMVFFMNKVFFMHGGDDAVAAFSVMITIGNTCNCITTGVDNVSLTMTGIFYHDEDRTSLRTLLHYLVRCSIVMGICVGVGMIIFAPRMAGLFLTKKDHVYEMATLGIRLYALGLIPSCFAGELKNAYQSVGRVKMTEVLAVMEKALLPIIGGLLFGMIFKVSGVFLYFVFAEIVVVTLTLLYVRMKTGKNPVKDTYVLMLPEDFYLTSSDMIEESIHNVDDVVRVSAHAEEFCMEKSGNSELSYNIGLCVEEMAANTITHGFIKDQKPHHLSVRVMNKQDHWLIRFRDDCISFNPVEYIPREGKDALGIRLVLKIADEVRYTYSLSLNNLTIILNSESIEQLSA